MHEKSIYFSNIIFQICVLGDFQEVWLVQGGQSHAGRSQILRIHLSSSGRPPNQRRQLHHEQEVPHGVTRHEHGMCVRKVTTDIFNQL